MTERGISLVATVGKYHGMDRSLAEELKKLSNNAKFKKLSNNAKFEMAIAKITEWAMKDLRTRRENEQEATSPELTI